MRFSLDEWRNIRRAGPAANIVPICTDGAGSCAIFRDIADLVSTDLQGRDDPRCSGMVSGHVGRRGLLHACVDASGTVEGWKRGRGPSAFFWRIPYPAILVPRPGPMPCRKRHGSRPSTKHPMRDLAKPGLARRPGRSRRLSREGTVRGIAHRVKPEWWAAGRWGGHPRFLEEPVRHPRPQPGAGVRPQAHRSRPPRSPDARSSEAWAREKAGGVRVGSGARGRFAGSRASGEAGNVGRGALGRERCLWKKRGWPPAALRSFYRSLHPQERVARPATAGVDGHGRRAW